MTAMNKLNAQGTRAEEESVPRQGRRGTSGQGWFKRLSDLTVFPSQTRSYRWPGLSLSKMEKARCAGLFYEKVADLRGSFNQPINNVSSSPSDLTCQVGLMCSGNGRVP
ncbi:hypothetical protein IBT54_002777 [Pantoea sp. S62]|nr:hypothetical protein [Pantoea sp. S62]